MGQIETLSGKVPDAREQGKCHHPAAGKSLLKSRHTPFRVFFISVAQNQTPPT